MSHDVIEDRYARLYELPWQLAQLGNTVQGICLSYQGATKGYFSHPINSNQVLVWHSFNAGPFWIGGLLTYLIQLKKIITAFKPDVLLGSSDCLHAIITACLAKLSRKPYVIDLYDNYASFSMAKIPGILPLYHWALKNATGISCVSQPLAIHIKETHPNPSVLTLESSINLTDFYPIPQNTARAALGLPEKATIIGVAGSLNRERGINLLYDSFLQLAPQYPDLHLALAGPPDSTLPIPQHPRIHYLGLLPHKAIVNFYSALDLAVVCMRDTDFGRYAFPQKTYEILACKTPILTANVGALKDTLKAYPQCLYQADNLDDLQAKIAYLLANPIAINIPIPSWQEQAKQLTEWLQTILPTNNR